MFCVVQLYAKCTLTLESAYYNEKVAMWEPLIEPIEHKDDDVHKPWQLAIEVCTVCYDRITCYFVLIVCYNDHWQHCTPEHSL